jgi:hypothetical protein
LGGDQGTESKLSSFHDSANAAAVHLQTR